MLPSVSSILCSCFSESQQNGGGGGGGHNRCLRFTKIHHLFRLIGLNIVCVGFCSYMFAIDLRF